MTKSTSKAEIVPVNFIKHENSDFLSWTKIWGYTYVGNTESWKGVTHAVFFPPDSLLDTTRSEFAEFAKDAKYDENSLPCKPGKYYRVKSKNIRGLQSYGFAIPAPASAVEGEDWAERLGVKHYESELIQTTEKKGKGLFIGGEVAKAPNNINACYYDIDSFLRFYKEVFDENETVLAVEKIEGCNGCYVYSDGEYHCRSRNEWKREFASPPKITLEELVAKIGDEQKAKDVYNNKIVNFKPPQNLWWRVLRSNEPLQKFLKDHPGYIVYGEVYSHVKNFVYDGDGTPKFRAFDIRYDGRFMNIKEAMELGNSLEWAPVLDESRLDLEKLTVLATGNTTLGKQNHIKEGIIVRGLEEKWNYYCGRNILKLKNPRYLERG